MFWALTAGMFFYLFPVVFRPLNIPLALLAYTIFFVLWAVRPIYISINAIPLSVVFTLLFLAVYSALVTMLAGMHDLTFAVQMAKVATLYLGSGVIIGIICVGLRVAEPFDVIIRAFVICCFIQAIFIAISIFSVQFRVVMDALVLATGNTNYLESFRVRGFSASGGPALGLNQALGVLSSFYLFHRTKKGFYLYIAIAITIPTFFVARTGFFLAVIFLIFNFLSINRIKQACRSIFLQPFGFVFFAFSILVLIIVIPNISSFFDYDALGRVEYAIRWGLEIFINAQSGDFESETTSALMEMLVVPSELHFLLFGFGVFDIGAFGYERTDSGYLKTLYASGLIGVLVLYGTLFSTLLLTAIRYRQPSFVVFMTLFFAVLIVVEIKEPFLYQNYAGRFAFILIGAGSVINWKRRTRFNSNLRVILSG